MDTIVNPVAETYRRVRDEIAEAAYAAGRSSEEIRLVAVTKFIDTDRIRPVFGAGCLEVGENRAQELVGKYDFFKEYGQIVHFIGQLQLNKVKYLVGRADLIQSVDRMGAFLEINRIASLYGTVQDVLVEINIGDEPQKAGIARAKLPELLSEISDMPCVRVKGLMCIPPMAGDAEVRSCFARMRELFMDMKERKLPNVSMDILSMGMSGDYRSAVAEGATMVRIGSAIFGARSRH